MRISNDIAPFGRQIGKVLFLDKEFSLQDFEDSFTFYAKEPRKMESLLDSVLTRIQMME